MLFCGIFKFEFKKREKSLISKEESMEFADAWDNFKLEFAKLLKIPQILDWLNKLIMKGKDLIQPDKQKRPFLSPNGIRNWGKGLDCLYLYNKNVITDKDDRVVKWCDARHGKLYMFWQRIKFKIFKKL
jgi:hypothetical protein